MRKKAVTRKRKVRSRTMVSPHNLADWLTGGAGLEAVKQQAVDHNA
ncbi:MAG: hypothetical protein WCS70_00120 [Verrucomicrobiota bacterium]